MRIGTDDECGVLCDAEQRGQRAQRGPLSMKSCEQRTNQYQVELHTFRQGPFKRLKRGFLHWIADDCSIIQQYEGMRRSQT